MANMFHRKGFVVWGICAFFFLYEFLLRTVIGTFQAPLMNDLHLTSLQFSLLSTTIFFLIYGVMQIPVGLIVDNIGLKKALLFASVCCCLSSFGFAYAHSFKVALAFRMLMGLGASFGFICLLVSVYDWMPRKYTAIFIGLSQFIGTLGPMLAAGPLDNLSQSSGVTWQSVFVYLGVFGGVLSVLVLAFVENNQEKTGNFIILYKPEKIISSLKRLFVRGQPWFLALLSVALYFTVEYLSENEGRSFLELKHISEVSANYMITISWIGYAIGCPMLGFVSDLRERRKEVFILSAIFGLLAILGIMYSSELILLQVAFFLLGMSASGQSVCFASVSEQFSKQFVAVGFGLNNGMITLFSAINAPIIGFLIDHKRAGGALSLSVYMFAFKVLIIIAVVAVLLALFFVKETYCKSQVTFTIAKK